MKTFFYYAFAVVSLFCLVACDKDEQWSKFEPIKTEVTGIALSPDGSGFVQSGTLPAEGGRFVVKAYSAFGKLGSVTVDGTVVWTNDWTADVTAGETAVSSDWGSVTYITAEEPFEMSFDIAANTTGKPRDFLFEIGGVWYRKTEIRISQE